MAIKLERLDQELRLTLPVIGISFPWDPARPLPVNSTTHTRAEGLVRLDWSVAPSAAQVTQANTLVTAHDGSPSPEEKMENLGGMPDRVLKAVILRLSASFTTAAPVGMTAAEKARMQTVLDNAGSRILTAIRS